MTTLEGSPLFGAGDFVESGAPEPSPGARLFPDMPAADYYADPCELPSLTQSLALTLVEKSPAHAYRQHPRLGGQAEPSTKAQGVGAVSHDLILCDGENVDEIDSDSFRTKAAREARDESLAFGRLPVLSAELERLREIATKARERLDAVLAALSLRFDDALREAVIVWHEKALGRPVVCRGRMDLLWPAKGLIVDLKFWRDGAPQKLGREMVSLGSDIQAAAYTSAVVALRPDLAGRARLLFLNVEPSGAFEPTLYEPDGSMVELGVERWRKAVEIWAQCLRRDDWPGYVGPGEVLRIPAPPWKLREVMEGEG